VTYILQVARFYEPLATTLGLPGVREDIEEVQPAAIALAKYFPSRCLPLSTTVFR